MPEWLVLSRRVAISTVTSGEPTTASLRPFVTYVAILKSEYHLWHPYGWEQVACGLDELAALRMCNQRNRDSLSTIIKT